MENLQELIVKAQYGDVQAFGTIYKLFYQRIYRFCYINCYQDSELASDICQETFMRAWKTIRSFSWDKGGSFQAYLFRIARNLIIDQSRKKKESPIEEAEEIEDTTYNFEESLDKNDDSQRLSGVLQSLDGQERQLVTLRFFEELSFSEVAQTTGMSEGNVRVKTHRLLKKLKKILEKSYGREHS